MKRKKGLTQKFILCFASVLIFSMSVQAFMNYRNSNEIIMEYIESSNVRTLRGIQDDIYMNVTQMKRSIDDIYANDVFMYDLKNNISVSDMQYRYKRLAHSFYVDHFSWKEDGVVSVYIYDMAHNCISYYRHSDTPKYKYPKDIYENEEKYNSSIVREYIDSDEKEAMISSYYNDARECNILRFVFKIFADNGSRQIGYFVFDIEEKVFQKIVDEHITFDKQIVCIQPVGDRVALTYGEAATSQKEQLDRIADSIQHPEEQDGQISLGKNNKIFMESNRGYNLQVYSVVPESVLRNESRTLIIYFALTAGCLILISLILIYFLSNYLIHPLKELIKTMKRIKRGEKEVRQEVNSNDEIGEIGENFNEMLDQLEKLIAEEYEARILKDSAEYKALQAQINPHFLYNTLETMSGIARVKSCDEVSELCLALSHMFRYSIDMKLQTASIGQELTHLSNYLYVMQVRMAGSVEVQIDVDTKYRQMELPKIALQPIVENAFSHGFKNKRGEKWLKIYVKEKDKVLFVIVEDNGVGTEEKRINAILQEGKETALERNSSIGLCNINERIKMLYGADYGIKVESEIDKGCRVVMKIPAKIFMGIQE